MARLGNFRKDIELLVSDKLSPQARQRTVANYARKVLAETQSANRRALGRDTEYEQAVDGRKGATLESVNPDHGTIVFSFDLGQGVLEWIGEQLVLNSPVLTGKYRASHVMLADGVEIDLGAPIPPAEEYIFVNTVPYARKIERGLSDQAPEGVFEVIADMAKRRFGNIADVKFTYRSILLPYIALGGKKGGKMASPAKRSAHSMETETRNPAISVRIR